MHVFPVAPVKLSVRLALSAWGTESLKLMQISASTAAPVQDNARLAPSSRTTKQIGQERFSSYSRAWCAAKQHYTLPTL